MGSAAFLNEAVNQLAEAYLERKQPSWAPHPARQYPQELQKVRMYLADRNVFGVDLNPVAVELAEVSCGSTPSTASPRDKDGNPLRGPPACPGSATSSLPATASSARARRSTAASLLKKGAKPAWHEPPRAR
jgi:hypothetical protein